MAHELQPVTDQGRRFVERIEEHLEEFRARAGELDRTNTFAAENVADLRRSGVVGGFVPEKLGGLGLDTVHDWAVGIERLARADASTAIALNMHLGICRNLALSWAAARERDDAATEKRQAGVLGEVVAGRLIIAATATEAGTDFLRPTTTATPEEGGYRIDGRKIFVTLSPASQLLALNVRIPDGGDGDRMGFAFVPTNAPGVEQQDDWDALGMRGSGSQSVVFDGCRVDHGAVQVAGPWGRWTPGLLMGRTLGNLTLVAAFLGIAERARELAIDGALRQTKLKHGNSSEQGEPGGALASSAGVQHLVGELEIDLAAARSSLAEATTQLDRFLADLGGETPTLEQAHACMAHYQCAKWIVNRGAIRVVDRAMDICGGGAYMGGHELSRLYRDVRAGPFMQPFSPTEAREYLGRVALGRPPEG